MVAEGKQGKDGYVTIPLAAQQAGEHYAHRDAWAAANGPIPAGMVVRHSCDNPPCRNVEHLLLGTHADNMADMVERGRHPSTLHPELRQGVRCGAAKLNDDRVREIRRRYAAGGESHLGLAREFGVSEAAIFKVINRETWKHVN